MACSAGRYPYQAEAVNAQQTAGAIVLTGSAQR